MVVEYTMAPNGVLTSREKFSLNLSPLTSKALDYERMARDMELNGDVVTIDGDRGSVYVFQNC